MKSIFLDNNSTTMIHEQVIEAMHDCQLQQLANPASQHVFGRTARRVLENAKEQIASDLGLSNADQCILTSGGTEANNLAIFGHFPANRRNQGLNIVSTAIEHPSILAALEVLKNDGVEVRYVNPNGSGAVCATDFENQIDDQTRLVCCMLGNNETGVIQPADEIASICADRKIPFHVDAVQAIGKSCFDFREHNFCTATISPHKFHGPAGIGALLIRDFESPTTQQLSPQLYGGFQQSGVRPGTECVPLAVGFAKALSIAVKDLNAKSADITRMRDRFEHLLADSISEITFNGKGAKRLPHTTNVSFHGIDRQQFVLAADMQQLAVSTGSACSSGSSQPSQVLTSMGCEKSIVESAIRFGFSFLTTNDEVTESVRRISLICNNLRRLK